MSHYYLGIDASKGYADFVLLNEHKAPVAKGFQLDDTSSGHHHLLTYLQEFVTAHPNVTISAALESTGGYENNWYRRLSALSQQLPLRVARLNPARVKHNSQASAKRNRTDQISAQDVAEYLVTHPDKVIYNEPEGHAQLRRVWSQIQMLVKQKTQLLNHLESALYSSMPELLSFCRHGVPRWLLNVLVEYPTYQQLQRAPLTQIPYVSTLKAQQLLARIEEGIGGSTPLSGHIISTLATQILTLDQQITRTKKYLEKNCPHMNEQVTLLCSFKGIGTYSAVGLLVYIGAINRFPSVKQLVSYFGIHPVFKQSGDGTWGNHMSKQGAADVRALLYMVAWSALQHNPLIKDLYARSRAKGMHANAALGVCMHKILRIVYGMLTHNTPFDPQTDREYTERTTHTSAGANKCTNIQRRAYDEHAPISRRQNKKRKEQTLSQDENLVMCGINQPAPSLHGATNTILRKSLI
ncbi:MAG: IS110 family transposase [Bacteroidota bacterium]